MNIFYFNIHLISCLRLIDFKIHWPQVTFCSRQVQQINPTPLTQSQSASMVSQYPVIRLKKILYRFIGCVSIRHDIVRCTLRVRKIAPLAPYDGEICHWVNAFALLFSCLLYTVTIRQLIASSSSRKFHDDSILFHVLKPHLLSKHVQFLTSEVLQTVIFHYPHA